MHSSYHTLAAVAESLATQLPGHVLEEAYTQERDELILRFSSLPDHLIVSCRPDLLCCYLHDSVARAKRNSASVLQDAINRVVQSVSIHPTDRVVSLHLSGADSLIIQFFGARSNVLLLSNNIIQDAFKRTRALTGTAFAAPPVQAVLAPEDLAAAARDLPQHPLAATLKKQMPFLPTIAVREILHRAGLRATDTGADLSATGVTALTHAIAGVANDLDHPRPRIYSTPDGALLDFSIIPLSELEGSLEDRFDKIHVALRSFVSRKKSAENIADGRSSVEQRLRSRIDHAQRIVRAIESDLATGDRADLYMQYGDAILQHMADIPKGASSVILPSSDATLAIPLQPTQTASQNAQRYFEKAKASKRARLLAKQRRTTYLRRTERTAVLLAELEQISTRQELKAFMERHHADMHPPGEDGPTDDQDHPIFRTFVVEGGFEVWAGKSSANNDVLTLRHAKPQDYWFHARGVPGSHVILRVATGRGEPSKAAIRQAASIAAYYSKMRTASMVPVAVTRRKYVHKPKGASAGSVVLQREDVIMVEPELPQPIEDNDE
jgi:predicted ribosome quality control (RQC) complex YloA/Tae2 family protein